MSKRLQKAKIEHAKFLTSHGVHPTQLKEKKKLGNYLGPRRKPAVKIEEKVFLEDFSAYNNTGRVRGILANLHKEPPHVQEKILALKSRVVPLYNKGGLQVMTEEEDKNFHMVGHKTRRL